MEATITQCKATVLRSKKPTSSKAGTEDELVIQGLLAHVKLEKTKDPLLSNIRELSPSQLQMLLTQVKQLDQVSAHDRQTEHRQSMHINIPHFSGILQRAT